MFTDVCCSFTIAGEQPSGGGAASGAGQAPGTSAASGWCACVVIMCSLLIFMCTGVGVSLHLPSSSHKAYI